MKKYIYIFAFLGLSLCNQSCMNKLEILPNDQIITDKDRRQEIVVSLLQRQNLLRPLVAVVGQVLQPDSVE